MSLFKLLFFLLPAFSLLADNIDYFVHFIGVEDKKVVKSLQKVSLLTTLQAKPPDSIQALRFRANDDIPNLLNVLHAYGYYDATIQVILEEQGLSIQLFVFIDPGIAYTLEEYDVSFTFEASSYSPSCPSFCLEDLGLELGEVAIAQKIVIAEEKLLSLLSEQGYPLALVKKREMSVDGKTKGKSQ